MKKRTMREVVLLSLIIVGAIGYGLWEFYIKPSQEELATKRDTISQLEMEAMSLESKQASYEELRKQGDDQETKIGAYKQTDIDFLVNAQNLLAYLGPIAEENKVSITLFKELEREDGDGFYVKNPFHLVLQGDYTTLLKVMGSISDLDYNYNISEYSMKVIDVDAKTNKPIENTASKKEYKWTSGNNTYVTGEFPLFRVEKIEEEATVSEEEKKIEDYERVKKVQIEFKLNFFLFDDQNMKKDGDVLTGETGKDDPFNTSLNTDLPKKEGEVDDDYLGEDLKSPLSDSKRAVFMADKNKLKKEVDKTLSAIYNREQKKLKTDQQMTYLKELLAISENQAPVKENDKETNTNSTESAKEVTTSEPQPVEGQGEEEK